MLTVQEDFHRFKEIASLIYPVEFIIIRLVISSDPLS